MKSISKLCLTIVYRFIQSKELRLAAWWLTLVRLSVFDFRWRSFGGSMDGGEHHVGLLDTRYQWKLFISVTLDTDAEEFRIQKAMAIFESIKGGE